MPLKWEPPELFLDWDGAKIYHTYKDGDPNNQSEFCFTTHPEHDDCTENSPYVFDVSDLPPAEDCNDELSKQRTLRVIAAIEGGLLTFPGEEATFEIMVPEVHYSTYHVKAPKGTDPELLKLKVDNELDEVEHISVEYSHALELTEWIVKELK